MSNYVKTVNFASKDALTTGNALKLIKGTEIGTEYDNIATASATKANKLLSPTTNNLIMTSAGGDLVDSGISTDGSGVIDGLKLPKVQYNTKVATTSGATASITSIPSWCQKITISLNDVGVDSFSASEYLMLRLGSGGYETSGYTGSTHALSTLTTLVSTSTTSYPIAELLSNSDTYSGTITLVLHDATTNDWVSSGLVFNLSALVITNTSAGHKALAGTLDSLQFLFSASATFDSGSINVIFEGAQ